MVRAYVVGMSGPRWGEPESRERRRVCDSLAPAEMKKVDDLVRILLTVSPKWDARCVDGAPTWMRPWLEARLRLRRKLAATKG